MPKSGRRSAPSTRMKRPRMTAFWMEVALKVSEVEPSEATVM